MIAINSIKFHKVRVQWQLDRVPKRAEKNLNHFKANFEERPFTLVSASMEAMQLGTYQWFCRNDKDALMQGFRFAHLSSSWNWKALENSGPHKVELPDTPSFVCAMVEPNSDIDMGTWLEGIYVAMILRDIGAVKVYGEADPEKVVRYGQTTPDPWEIPYIKFLNGIWAFDTNIGTHLKDALKGADPSHYSVERADYLLNIISPVMELWAMVFGKDEARFNAKLLEQQQLRRDWHEALGEESGNSIMEYIDLAALAAVCHAHDKGFKIDVKSDYLPEFLINGDFPKLEWPDPEWKEWPKA